MSGFRLTCVHCGAAVATMRLFCGECGRVHHTQLGTSLAPEDAPRSWLTSKDHAVLRQCLERHGKRDEFIARLIRAKLAQAVVVLSDAIDPTVATLNSRILFCVSEGPMESRTLVYWDRDSVVGIGLPVSTSLGIALLGAKTGDRVLAENRDGSKARVAVIEIAYQPEAARRTKRASEVSTREAVDLSGPVPLRSPCLANCSAWQR